MSGCTIWAYFTALHCLFCTALALHYTVLTPTTAPLYAQNHFHSHCPLQGRAAVFAGADGEGVRLFGKMIKSATVEEVMQLTGACLTRQSMPGSEDMGRCSLTMLHTQEGDGSVLPLPLAKHTAPYCRVLKYVWTSLGCSFSGTKALCTRR
jgi:hypothetical protein